MTATTMVVVIVCLAVLIAAIVAVDWTRNGQGMSGLLRQGLLLGVLPFAAGAGAQYLLKHGVKLSTWPAAVACWIVVCIVFLLVLQSAKSGRGGSTTGLVLTAAALAIAVCIVLAIPH